MIIFAFSKDAFGSLEQWFMTGSDFAPEGTLGNV